MRDVQALCTGLDPYGPNITQGNPIQTQWETLKRVSNVKEMLGTQLHALAQ
jgi:hypothetical protein